jgi:hypothetical protein
MTPSVDRPLRFAIAHKRFLEVTYNGTARIAAFPQQTHGRVSPSLWLVSLVRRGGENPKRESAYRRTARAVNS